MKIAYLGPEGTFSEEAALMQARLDGSTLMPFSSIPALVSAVETGLTERAVLPIENSLEGSVSFTLDLLIDETDLKICNELVVPVRHNLVVVPGAALNDIKTVTSHPQGLGQCRRFLERCLPGVHQVAALSTSTAVEKTIEAGDRSQAAIGTERAALLYGGEILARDIQDNRSNVTRFFVLAQTDAEPTGFRPHLVLFQRQTEHPRRGARGVDRSRRRPHSDDEDREPSNEVRPRRLHVPPRRRGSPP